jgi:hypothetical protein
VDETDRKLARVSRRLQTARDEARSHFQGRPEFRDLRAVVEAFAGKVEWVRVADFTWGRDHNAGSAPCVPYKAPRRRKADERRAEESR